MARREVKVPLARLWILLSYRESRERFCRSWKASGRMQLILLAFKSLRAETGSGVRSDPHIACTITILALDTGDLRPPHTAFCFSVCRLCL